MWAKATKVSPFYGLYRCFHSKVIRTPFSLTTPSANLVATERSRLSSSASSETWIPGVSLARRAIVHGIDEREGSIPSIHPPILPPSLPSRRRVAYLLKSDGQTSSLSNRSAASSVSRRRQRTSMCPSSVPTNHHWPHWRHLSADSHSYGSPRDFTLSRVSETFS